MSPKPTTKKPVTAPPLNASWSAGLIPPRAASAVRRLERTEMFMPTYPAAPLSTAPIRKRTPVFHPSVKVRNRKMTAPIPAMIVYCRLR